MTDWTGAICRRPGTNPDALWMSDHANQRAKGAALCTACPALGPCDLHLSTLPEIPTHGVWAGVDYTSNTGRAVARKCTSCGQVKMASQFTLYSTGGLRPTCHACRNTRKHLKAIA